MAKFVNKTYGKKVSWGSGSSQAFDEAKLQSKLASPKKIVRPNIWAKVPLVESFSESPPRPKKKFAALSTTQIITETENGDVTPKKKTKKRKIQDPFGFGDLDEQVVPASEYISPKKKKMLQILSPKKGSPIKAGSKNLMKKKKDQVKANKMSPKKNKDAVDKTQLLESPSQPTIEGSPKKRGRPPKDKSFVHTSTTGTQSKQIGTGLGSPKKRGRPPKEQTLNSGTQTKGTVVQGLKSKQSMSPKKTSFKPKQRVSNSHDKKLVAQADCPKKRGRPPKKKSAVVYGQEKPLSPVKHQIIVAGSPKKRGRPPKEKPVNMISSENNDLITEEESTKLVSPMKNGGPGPKKHTKPSIEKIVQAVISKKLGKLSKGKTNENESPKKRGRPPNDKSVQGFSPKKPVSPSKKELAKAGSPKKLDRPPKKQGDEMASPKKPGRPPKDRSIESHSPKKNVSPSKMGVFQAGSPKKLGRPPKVQQAEVASPKKRGRPAKDKPVEDFSLQKGAGQSKVDIAQDDKPNIVGRTPKKIEVTSPKKRGRPKKVRNLVPNSSSDGIISSPSKSDANSSKNVTEVISNAFLVKRKRQRKLKKPVDTDIVFKETQEIFGSLESSQPIESAEAIYISSSLEEKATATKTGNRKRKKAMEQEVNGGIHEPLSSQELSLKSESVTSDYNSSSQSLSQAEIEASGRSEETTPKKVRFSSEHSAEPDSVPSARESIGSETGSPFKWFLKNNEKTLSPRKVAQLRRFSVLPTCTPGNDDDDIDSDVVPFGLPWAMQQDESSLKVNKDEKELFTIVRNTKQAQESVEFGESQQFKDDVEYLLDGIGDTNSLSTRCLSLIELASKCSKSAFRMNLRAHGTIAAIFDRLNDAPSNQHLALCTAAVMFMLTRDRMNIDFDKSILEMMLKLLALEESPKEQSSKEWIRLILKIKGIFEKNVIQGVNNLDLSQLTTESLARESFLSLTSQRTGSWFKDEIRLLGGLDHIVDTVVSCSKCLKVNGKSSSSDSAASVRQIERCLKLLENVTVQCPSNQGYLVSYRDSALLETCARLLKFSVASLFENESETISAVQGLWFSTMKMLLNLTHDNELASTRFCQKSNVLGILLKSALQLPAFLPAPKQFDVAVLSLGLLINLVEYSKKNLTALNAAIVPSSGKGGLNESEAVYQTEDSSTVESLLQLFLVRLEAAKENSGMEEDLAKLNNSLHNSSIRIGSDGLSLVCGDDLEKSQNEESAVEKDSGTESSSIEITSAGETSSEEKSSEKEIAEKEAEHIGKALQKAGQHMEDSLIASYAALLLGLLAEDNKENQQLIHDQLQYGDFGIMTHTLDKFLAFMNMTANTSNSSSALVIKRAIATLQQCKKDFPPRPLTS